MSYAIYIGSNHTRDGHAWLGGYGDEPSSHWLDIVPRATHTANETLSVGMTAEADMPGRLIEIPEAKETYRHVCVNYTYYKGAPAPLVNGGLNEHGVAVRDVWSPSRQELIDMTPLDQSGPNYSDLARMVISRAHSAREGVDLIAETIDTYGESTYGGNSHLIADADEAWVMIQFAGGQGLWAAERLGPSSIRASRPGYISQIPVNEPDHPDFRYSENFIDFAKTQGWYDGEGPFDANRIYGDGNGRWDGVRWIEDEMAARSARAQKIGFDDMAWAVRTARLTGDTAGYGQIVPLSTPIDHRLRVLWHAPIGPVAAPFSPVFVGQTSVPDEFRLHRYLTTGEARTHMINPDIVDGGHFQASGVSQSVECSRSAVMACKRLLYLMLCDPDGGVDDVTSVFENRENALAAETAKMLEIAETLIAEKKHELAETLLTYFSSGELLKGLDLVETLAGGIEARLKFLSREKKPAGNFASFDQIW